MTAPALDERVLDRARLSRDARFDGTFFVAVTTTGIYCRPICPARTAKREHIRFFATAAAAAAAGFRPCLRCRPERAPGLPAWLGPSAVVGRALGLIDDGFLDATSVCALAASVGVGARHLRRLFDQYLGVSPAAVARTRRLHFAKRLLDETQFSITQIAMEAGFGSVRRFNSAFRAGYRRAPSDVRRARRDAASAARAAHGDEGEVRLKLAYRPPYDWRQVFEFLAARAVTGVERASQSEYARTVVVAGGFAVVRMRPVAGEHALELSVRGATPGALLKVATAARRAFDLAADPARILAALRGDPFAALHLRLSPGTRIPGTWDPFECAVRAVLGQQVTVAAGRTLVARAVARAGRRVADNGDGLTHLFPSAHELAAADLDGLGITRARVEALRALTAAVANGRVAFDAPREQVVAALLALPGVGAWTAEYIALRALGDPDAFPASDLELRRAAGTGKRPLSTRALAERAESWRPWRGYVAIHLWCAGRVPKEKIST